MFSLEKPLPFGLSRQNWIIYVFFALVVLTALHDLDGPVSFGVLELPHWIRAPFYVITRAGNSDWILIPTLLASLIGAIVLRMPTPDNLKASVSWIAWRGFFIFTAVAVPGITALFFKRMIGRSRPVNITEFGVLHFEPVVNDWRFQSFPSGDTTTIFALAAALAFLSPKYKVWFFFGAALVGLSRIMVGVHFPTDVFGGILTGLIGAFLVRNYFAKKKWLFEKNDDGHYQRIET